MRSVIKIIWKMDPTRMILAVAVAVVTGIVPFFYVTAYAHFIGSTESFLGQQGMGTFLSILIQFLVFGLFNFLGQKKIIPFFFLGFFLAQFLSLNTMAITVFGAIIAFIIYLFEQNKVKEVA